MESLERSGIKTRRRLFRLEAGSRCAEGDGRFPGELFLFAVEVFAEGERQDECFAGKA